MATAPDLNIDTREKLEAWLADKPPEWAASNRGARGIAGFPLVLPVVGLPEGAFPVEIMDKLLL